VSCCQSLRWVAGCALAAGIVLVPYLFFRYEYTHGKRLREVDAGKLYRCGQLTATGFAEVVGRHGIKTVLNLQDEFPDPDVDRGFVGTGTVKESALCRQLGVRYVHLPPDLISRRDVPAHRPEAIDKFLAVMDDPANYPVLVHCRAGLHRTGVLVAVYRMEYQGYSPREAVRDLKANGFSEFACTSFNDYITQYVLTYRPGVRVPPDRAAAAGRAGTAVVHGRP
jgi:tyrosine-protein phosphatase SIW14